MPYVQRNYNEIQGINGRYRIKDIGCFITAFCNLLERFGKPIDPLTLNAIFRDRGIYIDVDDGIRDDVGWQTITAYDGSVIANRVGNGAPLHNDSIVKFVYTSPNTGKQTTHFSVVVDAAKGLIYDSWDGIVKSWNIYGGPKAYASYVNITPQPVQPVVPRRPDVSLQPFASPVTMQVIKNEGAERWNFSEANNWNEFISRGHLNYGDTFIAYGKAIHPLGGIYLYDDSRVVGVNAADAVEYIEPAPTPVPLPNTETTITTPVPPPAVIQPTSQDGVPVTIHQSNQTDWKSTYIDEDIEYISTGVANIKDFNDATQPILSMPIGVKVSGGGRFKYGDVWYIRSKKSIANGWWYGVPESVLDPISFIDALHADAMNNPDVFNTASANQMRVELQGQSRREKIVKAVARVYGGIIKIASIVKLGKKKQTEGVQ